MLENIHDIAPGASLAFATAYAAKWLRQQHRGPTESRLNVIVDDVGYPDEPMFQDGIVAQAVDTVVATGVTYFSAAGNEGPDSGYLSNFRAATGKIAGIGSGTFMNFNPSGGSQPRVADHDRRIPNAEITSSTISLSNSRSRLAPRGVVRRTSTSMSLTPRPAHVVVGPPRTRTTWRPSSRGSSSRFRTRAAITSRYRWYPGPIPGTSNSRASTIPTAPSTSARSMAARWDTYYPSSFGHATAADTIGVGATPWWAPSPYLGQNPLANEPFSSSGRRLSSTSMAFPCQHRSTVRNPTLTAPDGGNTSFFSPGSIIDTSNPPFPGQPATATNLSQDLPSFFGTSSAAPNAAAVAALMLQEVPNLTPAEIRQGLIDGATPMNGTDAGTWNRGRGYGLVNAINAINAVDFLRVVSPTRPTARPSPFLPARSR